MQDYEKAGLSINKPWTAADYTAAAQVLARAAAGHAERLPRWHDPQSGAVFAKLVMPVPEDWNQRVADRFAEHAERFDALNALAKLYMPDQLGTPPREWIELMGAVLREACALERDADAFLASFGSNDPQHDVRVDGLAKAYSGYGSMLLGGLLVADQVRIPEDDRLAMLRYVTAALPILFPRTPTDTQHEIRDVLAKEAAGFSAEKLREAAVAAQRALPK